MPCHCCYHPWAIERPVLSPSFGSSYCSCLGCSSSSWSSWGGSPYAWRSSSHASCHCLRMRRWSCRWPKRLRWWFLHRHWPLWLPLRQLWLPPEQPWLWYNRLQLHSRYLCNRCKPYRWDHRHTRRLDQLANGPERWSPGGSQRSVVIFSCCWCLLQMANDNLSLWNPMLL